MEIRETRLSRLKEGQRKIRKEIKERTIGYILAAFSFIAGLAWNDAIKSIIDQFFPHNNNGIFIKVIYALLVTFIIVLITIYLTKLIKDKE